MKIKREVFREKGETQLIQTRTCNSVPFWAVEAGTLRHAGQSGDWIENVLMSRRSNENSEDAKEITMLKQILKRLCIKATEIF